jgi:hypothetical protein
LFVVGSFFSELCERNDFFKEKSHQQVQNRVSQVTMDTSTTCTFTSIPTPSRPIERIVPNQNDRDNIVLASSLNLVFNQKMK